MLRPECPKHFRELAEAHYTFFRSFVYCYNLLQVGSVGIVSDGTAAGSQQVPGLFSASYSNERVLKRTNAITMSAGTRPWASGPTSRARRDLIFGPALLLRRRTREKGLNSPLLSSRLREARKSGYRAGSSAVNMYPMRFSAGGWPAKGYREATLEGVASLFAGVPATSSGINP